jgi:hypothetical protein
LKRRILFIGLFSILLNTATAQVALMAGMNFSNVMENHLLENPEFNLSYHWGASVRVFPFKNIPKLSFEIEMLLNRKGYHQHYDSTYNFRFTYSSMPLLMRYSLAKNITLDAGVEISRLFSTNIKQGKKTYNNFDTGIVLGFTGFESKLINIYSRVTYGLLPMLDYYSFDKLGNFTGKIHDIRNLNISVGIKINLSHEKALVY